MASHNSIPTADRIRWWLEDRNHPALSTAWSYVLMVIIGAAVLTTLIFVGYGWAGVRAFFTR